MSVLIIKRELLPGTKRLKSHYQTPLQRRRRKRQRVRRRVTEDTHCISIININIHLSSPPSPSFNWLMLSSAGRCLYTVCVCVCQRWAVSRSLGPHNEAQSPRCGSCLWTHAQHKAATHTNHTHIWSTDRRHDLGAILLLSVVLSESRFSVGLDLPPERKCCS